MEMTVSSFLKFMPLIVSPVCYKIAMGSHGKEAGGRKGNTRRWNRHVHDTGRLPVAPFRTAAKELERLSERTLALVTKMSCLE